MLWSANRSQTRFSAVLQRLVLAVVDRAHERLEQDRVDVRAGGVGGVVLDGAEHLERVVALVEARA